MLFFLFFFLFSMSFPPTLLPVEQHGEVGRVGDVFERQAAALEVREWIEEYGSA